MFRGGADWRGLPVKLLGESLNVFERKLLLSRCKVVFHLHRAKGKYLRAHDFSLKHQFKGRKNCHTLPALIPLPVKVNRTAHCQKTQQINSTFKMNPTFFSPPSSDHPNRQLIRDQLLSYSSIHLL